MTQEGLLLDSFFNVIKYYKKAKHRAVSFFKWSFLAAMLHLFIYL